MIDTVLKDDIEDIQESVRTGRTVRPHGPYRVQIGNAKLEFHPAVIEDPVPTGSQILEAADARPADQHLVFQVLQNGLLEELRPDETTDLRAKGVEKFLVFRSDRSFRFELDGRIFEWGATLISGMTLKKLAGASDGGDVGQVTPVINGGLTGLDDRRAHFRLALDVIRGAAAHV